MLLKKNRGRLSALSLCLAVIFAPLFTAQADEPEIVPTDGSAMTAEQPTSLSLFAAGAVSGNGNHGRH